MTHQGAKPNCFHRVICSGLKSLGEINSSNPPGTSRLRAANDTIDAMSRQLGLKDGLITRLQLELSDNESVARTSESDAHRLRDENEPIARVQGVETSRVEFPMEDLSERAMRDAEVIAAAGDFYDSLTPAQQTKVREFMQKRSGWWNRS